MSYGSGNLEVLVSLFNTVYGMLTATAIGLLCTTLYLLYGVHSARVVSTVIQQPTLEVLWTLVPCVVIVVGTLHSLGALYTLDSTLGTGAVLHTTGNQWYWTVSTVGGTAYDSRTVLSSSLALGGTRLGLSDHPLYLPSTGATIVVSSSDVLHSLSLPSLGVKVDAIPGRLNSCVVSDPVVGTYSGYCNELCGAGHGFMALTAVVYATV